MVEDDGEIANDWMRTRKTLSTLLTIVSGFLAIIIVLVYLDDVGISPMPYNVTMGIVAVIFLCSVPFIALAYWMLLKYVLRDGYWGFLILFLGCGTLLIAGAAYLYISIFQPSQVATGIFIAIGVGAAITFLGMLMVLVQVTPHIVRSFKDMRQTPVGDEP